MASEENNYKHLLRMYYGDVVERGHFDKLNDFFSEKYVGHFPGKDLKFEELKEFLQCLFNSLRNINVEISNDRLEGNMLCHDLLFQGNRKEDMKSVEWRSSSKWKIEDGKVVESWPTTTLNFDQIKSAVEGKNVKAGEKQSGQSQPASAIPLPAK